MIKSPSFSTLTTPGRASSPRSMTGGCRPTSRILMVNSPCTVLSSGSVTVSTTVSLLFTVATGTTCNRWPSWRATTTPSEKLTTVQTRSSGDDSRSVAPLRRSRVPSASRVISKLSGSAMTGGSLDSMAVTLIQYSTWSVPSNTSTSTSSSTELLGYRNSMVTLSRLNHTRGELVVMVVSSVVLSLSIS